MAKAVVICKCKKCGKEFEKNTFRQNRTQANSWEEWAKDYYDECYSCYKTRIEEENREKVSAYNLPEIEAVSEKQFAYAESLRNKFVVNNDVAIGNVQRFIAKSETKEFKASSEAKGLDPHERLMKKINSRIIYKGAYACLTETNAGKIIDALKCL